MILNYLLQGKTLLWLYQVLPNIELVEYIYQLKRLKI